MTALNKGTEFHSPRHNYSSSYSENGLLLLKPLSQLFEPCLQLAVRQQEADPLPCWSSRCSVYFGFLIAEPCSSMNFAGKGGKYSRVGTKTHQSMLGIARKLWRTFHCSTKLVGCAIYWTGQYSRGKIKITLMKLFLKLLHHFQSWSWGLLT